MSHRPDADAPGSGTFDGRPRILLSVPAHESAAFFPPDTRRDLAVLGEVTEIPPGELQDPARCAAALAEVDVLVTAWGFPRLDAQHLSMAPRLRFVMHAASSLRSLVTDVFWAARIPVSQAGAAMAPSVAGQSLAMTLALLHRLNRQDHALRSGADWEAARGTGRPCEIAGARIGVIGASRTGRPYIDSCRALGADVQVYDPYLTPGDPLAPLATSLPELLATSDVVALHAPATDETRGMLGAAEIALIRDGGRLVNTARSSLVDMDALYEAVAAGRIDAALDVFDEEPLPRDDRWRALPNALLTAHLGGASTQSRHRAGRIVTEEIDRFLHGRELRHAVTREAMERMG
ncbi:hydroxyacid dehydrogenase [Streptomyces sp. NA04227]|uniref:hydroxyacid dehydrogenase n=1 Tax=Streptomyces sp. NA04227 TaxID=2742136 RepID=UPI001590A644|nr:hydroxyacid dehydrogenase [Streptomyces sp. NA04227]QKW10304.1 hydroxyacid dehydrogenase [Streptomyces sp. NA04227]